MKGKQVMIDYIKLFSYSSSFSKQIQNNSLLKHLSTWKSEKTGLIKTFYEFNGIKFTCFSSGRIEISGSLHKFYNHGVHNYNDFGYYQLKDTIYKLAELFGEEILEAKICNLEYGLNLNPLFIVEHFIASILIYNSKGAKPKHAITKNDLEGFTKGIRFELNEYCIKIYHKSQQYCDAKPNLLRVELKTHKMNFIKDAHIEDLVSLTDEMRLDYLHVKLLACMRNVLVNEPIYGAINKLEERLLLQYGNPQYLLNLKPAQKCRNAINDFKALKKIYCETDRLTEVEDLMNQKFRELQGTFCPSI